MNYTDRQIKEAKRKYNAMLRFHTLSDYNVNVIGVHSANQQMDFHNNIIESIFNGDKETIREWKLFFLNEEVKADLKKERSKAKKRANRLESEDTLRPIKKIRKLGEFGKWLNTSGNKFRKQHFNKCYTEASVEAFLKTL